MNQELQCLEQFEKEDNWFRANFSKLQEKFANKFVAIEGENVIASGDKSLTVLEKAKEKSKDLSMVLIEFVPEKGLVVII
jgi:hypothetical protein